MKNQQTAKSNLYKLAVVLVENKHEKKKCWMLLEVPVAFLVPVMRHLIILALLAIGQRAIVMALCPSSVRAWVRP